MKRRMQLLLAAVSTAVLGMWTGCGNSAKVEPRPAAECKAFAEYERYTPVQVTSLEDVPETCQAILLTDGSDFICPEYEDEEMLYYCTSATAFYTFPMSDCFEYIVNVPEEEEGDALQKLSERDLKRVGILGIHFGDLDALSHMEHLESLWLTGCDFTVSFQGNFPALTDLEIRYSNIDGLGRITDIGTLQRLTLENTGITNLGGIQKLTNLSKLSLSGSHIHSLKPLRTMTQLTSLDLSGQTAYNNRILPDLSQLSGMQNLRTLGLGMNPNGVKHPEALSELHALENLSLLDCALKSAEPVENLTNLKALDLTANHITDLEPLRGLTGLEILKLHNNEICDLSPLTEMPSLRVLIVGSNAELTDISPLEQLQALEEFSAYACGKLQTITALQNKKSLKRLTLSGTQAADPEILSTDTNLEELLLEGAVVKETDFLRNFPNLRKLDLTNTKIRDAEPIMKLRGLESLSVAGTRVESLEGISGLTALRELNISGTDIESIEELYTLGELRTLKAQNMRNIGKDALTKLQTEIVGKGGTCEISVWMPSN